MSTEYLKTVARSREQVHKQELLPAREGSIHRTGGYGEGVLMAYVPEKEL